MLITYKADFVPKILDGSKIHTIRRDEPNRYKTGVTLHQWKGNPCNPIASPYHFDTTKCVSTQQILILFKNDPRVEVIVDNRYLNPVEIEALAKNDGFLSSYELFKWFNFEDFKGKIIHWTDKRY
jgi:hypothetical protein